MIIYMSEYRTENITLLIFNTYFINQEANKDIYFPGADLLGGGGGVQSVQISEPGPLGPPLKSAPYFLHPSIFIKQLSVADPENLFR